MYLYISLVYLCSFRKKDKNIKQWKGRRSSSSRKSTSPTTTGGTLTYLGIRGIFSGHPTTRLTQGGACCPNNWGGLNSRSLWSNHHCHHGNGAHAPILTTGRRGANIGNYNCQPTINCPYTTEKQEFQDGEDCYPFLLVSIFHCQKHAHLMGWYPTTYFKIPAKFEPTGPTLQYVHPMKEVDEARSATESYAILICRTTKNCSTFKKIKYGLS